MRVHDIREALRNEYAFRGDRAPMIELIGTSFIADERSILREPNEEYIARELAWYESQSLYVDDIPGTPPAIWRDVADDTGRINSQYGYLVFGAANGQQYHRVREELYQNPNSRRGVMIYTRPSMHTDAVAHGMNDFVCTNVVNYFIRSGALQVVVQMRSNDVVFGYPNDLAWQRHVQEMLAKDLAIEPGHIVWQAASLHVYPRHYELLR